VQITFSGGLLDTDKGMFELEIHATMIDNLTLFNRAKRSEVSVDLKLESLRYIFLLFMKYSIYRHFSRREHVFI